jgi:hypothetical protein
LLSWSVSALFPGVRTGAVVLNRDAGIGIATLLHAGLRAAFAREYLDYYRLSRAAGA